MARFKFWLEEQGLRREQQAQVQRIYDLAARTLLGTATDQTHLSLSDLKDDGGDGNPSHKGALVALSKLNRAGIFERLKALGNPDLATRANQAQSYLRNSSNDQQVGPKDSIGQFFNRLFGDDATELYGKHSWQSAPHGMDHTPQDGQQALQPATSPPESQSPVQAPAMGPDVQGAPPPGGAPPGGTPPGAAPPGTPPGMPPIPGQPPQPGNPLQSPGGPMPPPPASVPPMV